MFNSIISLSPFKSSNAMKCLVIFLSSLFLGSFAFAQQFEVSLQLDRGNVIYTTIPNDFTFASNIASEDISCTINGKGIIKQQGYQHFQVVAPEPGTYYITFKQKSTGLSYSYSYRAKNLPIPTASISGAVNDSISTAQLSMAVELGLVYDNFDYNISADVVSFSVLKISNTNTRLELQNIGRVFSKEVMAAFNQSAPGDIFIFRNIKARGVYPQELKIPDTVIFVK